MNFHPLKETISLEFKQELYEGIKEMFSNANQWKYPDTADLYASHMIKTKTLLEILENIEVFHVGLGADLKSYGIKKRIKSFSYLEEKETKIDHS